MSKMILRAGHAAQLKSNEVMVIIQLDEIHIKSKVV